MIDVILNDEDWDNIKGPLVRVSRLTLKETWTKTPTLLEIVRSDNIRVPDTQ